MTAARPRHGARAFATAVGICLIAAASGAQTTTGDSASLLVFPKVIVNSSWDTVIQLSNNANRPARALCYYVNGALTSPDLPPGPLNPRLWTQVDFRLSLTRQQPTHWVASRGRSLSDDDGLCAAPFETCDGTGTDPGLIPPLDANFSGELVCIEVDASGAPWSGNALSGHATLTNLATGAVAKYPAIGARGLPVNDGNGRLCLGGQTSADCPSGAEYRGCSQQWTVSHRADHDARAVDGDASHTSLTIVPCAHDFVSQQPKRIVLQFEVTNELEQRFSASAVVECWADLQLADVGQVFDREIIGSDWVQTRVRAAASSTAGFVVLQQTLRTSDELPLFTATASVAAQRAGDVPADRILLPEGDGQ